MHLFRIQIKYIFKKQGLSVYPAEVQLFAVALCRRAYKLISVDTGDKTKVCRGAGGILNMSNWANDRGKIYKGLHLPPGTGTRQESQGDI